MRCTVELKYSLGSFWYGLKGERANGSCFFKKLFKATLFFDSGLFDASGSANFLYWATTDEASGPNNVSNFFSSTVFPCKEWP